MLRGRMLLFVAAWIAVGVLSVAHAQVLRPARSALVKQGRNDQSLARISALPGIKVEVAAEGGAVGRPLAIALSEQGTILALQAKGDAAAEQLVALVDADGNGTFEKSEIVMSDLAGRTSMLSEGGWYYFAGGGTVIRRRAQDSQLAAELQAAVDAKQGPPTTVTADRKWLEQTLIKGLSDKPADQTGGMAQGLDGSIYLSIGGTANRAESWDGSKATVLGSGAIFRFQPDGSKVREFARGFAAPTGPPTIDAFGVIFQADKTPPSSRIIHVLEAGDYGWRADIDPPQLDRPSTLHAIVTNMAPPPDSLLAYHGSAFPERFQGQLFTAMGKDSVIQAQTLEPAGNSFAVRPPSDLMRGDPKSFSPRLIALGPEGAIFVVDSSVAGARILRLTWTGTTDAPAIETPPLAAFKSAPKPAHADLLALTKDKSKPAAERAVTLGRACRAWDDATLEACLELLADENADLARLAVVAAGDHPSADKETLARVAETLQDKLLAGPLPVRRSLYLALGKLGTKVDSVPEWIFEATSVTPDVHSNRYLFQAHARAAEMPAGWATELMLGNLEVALLDVNPEPEERVRLKKFVVATAEQMRTRELANFLDKSIRDEKDYFSKLEAPLQARLLTAYQNVLVEPAIHADAVASWLDKHPQSATEVQQAAWDTLAKVGTSKPELVVAPAKAIVASGKIDQKIKASVLAALARHRDPAKRGEIDDVMESLSRVANQSP